MKEFKTMIEAARARLLTLDKGTEAVLGKMQYIHEFKTLQISMGRQYGHTTFVREYAQEGDIILTPRPHIHNEAYRGAKGTVVLASRLADYVRGKRVGDVWIDEPRLALEGMTREDWISTLLRLRDDSFIIMLGNISAWQMR